MASTAMWSFLGVVVAVLGTSPTAHGQVSTACNAWRDIDPQPNNPFTADSARLGVTWNPDGTEHTQLDKPGSIARDSNGRIYSEWHFRGSTPSIRKKAASDSADGKRWHHIFHSMTSLLDCGGGKATLIYPDFEIARVEEGPPRDPDRISFFEMLAYVQRPSNAAFEDLGYKEIEGFSTHGFKVTVLGTQQDGDWNAKPIEVTEAWVSDDLAMTMLEIITSLRSAFGSKYESRVRRSHIIRREPDASLFEIPAGYKINPAPEDDPLRETPFKANSKPSAQK
jgi:hypothetical protein